MRTTTAALGVALLLVLGVVAQNRVRAMRPSSWPAGSKLVGVSAICFERKTPDGQWKPAVLESHDGFVPVKLAPVRGNLWYAPPGELRVRLGDGC